MDARCWDTGRVGEAAAGSFLVVVERIRTAAYVGPGMVMHASLPRRRIPGCAHVTSDMEAVAVISGLAVGRKRAPLQPRIWSAHGVDARGLRVHVVSFMAA